MAVFVMNKYWLRSKKQRAFTLIEMLVVVAILGFVGMASFSMSSTAIRVKNSLISQEKIIFDGIRIWQWLERDMEQLVDRSVRGQLGEHESSLVLDNNNVSFSKAGWGNPLAFTRSELQRVQYRFNSINGELSRIFWPVMDIDQDTKPVIQVFSGVTEFDFQVLNASNDQWQGVWPSVENGLLLGESESIIPMPKLVRMSLTTDGLGKVSRQFLIPSYPYDNEAL